MVLHYSLELLVWRPGELQVKGGRDYLGGLDVHRQAMKERIDFQYYTDRVLSVGGASRGLYAVPCAECKDLA